MWLNNEQVNDDIDVEHQAKHGRVSVNSLGKMWMGDGTCKLRPWTLDIHMQLNMHCGRKRLLHLGKLVAPGGGEQS